MQESYQIQIGQVTYEWSHDSMTPIKKEPGVYEVYGERLAGW